MIRRTKSLLAVLCLGQFVIAPINSACAAEPLPDLPNVRQPQPHRISSGAVAAEDVAALKAAGVEHVIDLRAPQETPDFDEQAAVEQQGMSYHAIPISGAQSLTRENAQQLDQLLKEFEGSTTLVHCASGNRVGALIALREAWLRGAQTEAAIAEGRRWGLTSLEPVVREKLAQ